MKKIIAAILIGGGILGIGYFGYQYFQNSKSYEVLGADVAVSTGDYVPVLISVGVVILGIVFSKIRI